jgi:hypothetical protein
MNIGIALLALGLCCSAAEHKETIPSDSTIYVDPGTGFDKLLTAAFQAKHVSLRVVSVPEQADYALDSAVFPVAGETRRKSASLKTSRAEAVTLTSKAGEVVWRHTVTQHTLDKGSQAVADECASHMKGIVGKGDKPKS